MPACACGHTLTPLAWRRYIEYHGPTSPENILSNGDVRLILHVEGRWAFPWQFIEHEDGGYIMLLKHASVKPASGLYLAVPDDVEQRDCQSRYVGVTADVKRATRVRVELP